MPRNYLGAFKKGHRRSSREFIDEDFSITLLEKAERGCPEAKLALEWLSRFNNEFHKDVVRKGDAEALHNTDQLRRDCHRRNYLRRNDFYTAVSRIDLTSEALEMAAEHITSLYTSTFFNRKVKK